MKLKPKAQKALDAVVAKFQNGDLSPLVEASRLRLPEDAPASKWTLSNRVLAFAQSDSLDCRGYKQWLAAGRQVKRGETSAYILAPRIVKTQNKKTGEDESALRGWLALPVFGYNQTDGDEDSDLDYSPAELPPLADVAEALGIDVNYGPTPESFLGNCDTKGETINVGTHDIKTWFHELAHAVHARIGGQLKGGQDAHQETVAEFTATVLMWLYGFGDRTGNCWSYVSYYSPDDPLRAIVRAMGDVEKVLDFITEQAAEGLPAS